MIGTIWVRVDDPDAGERGDARRSTRCSATARPRRPSETEKSFFANFFGSLQGFVTIILIVTGLVTLCIVFIAANTASMSVRERVGRDRGAEGARLPLARSCSGRSSLEAALLSTLAGVAGVAPHAGRSRRSLRGRRRLEPAARPARRLHRDERDPGAGPLPRALRSAILSGVVPCLGRVAAQRRRRRCARCSRPWPLPLSYSLRNLFARRLRTALTVGGDRARRDRDDALPRPDLEPAAHARLDAATRAT